MTSTPLRVAITAATTTVVVLVVRASFDLDNQRLIFNQYSSFFQGLPADFIAGTVLPAVAIVPTVTVAAVVIYLAWRRR